MRAPRSSLGRRGAAAVLALALGWLPPAPALALRPEHAQGAGLEELATTLTDESWARIKETFGKKNTQGMWTPSQVWKPLSRLHGVARARLWNDGSDRGVLERRMAVAEVVAVAGQGAGLAPSLRGLLIAAILVQATSPEQRWASVADDGFDTLLGNVAKRGKIHPRVARDVVDHWVEVQRTQRYRTEESTATVSTHRAEGRWPSKWNPNDITTADQLLMNSQHAAWYLAPEDLAGSTAQTLPTPTDARGTPALAFEQSFQKVRQSVEFLLGYLDLVDPSYRIAWRSRQKPLLASFLNNLPRLAGEIGDHPTQKTAARDAFKARWELLRGALQESLEDARTEQPRRSNPFQRVDAEAAHQLVSQLQHARKGFTLKKPPHPLVVNNMGEVYRIVGVAEDGRLHLLPLADPREMISQAVSELVTNHDQGYVALKRSLQSRSGLEEGSIRGAVEAAHRAHVLQGAKSPDGLVRALERAHDRARTAWQSRLLISSEMVSTVIERRQALLYAFAGFLNALAAPSAVEVKQWHYDPTRRPGPGEEVYTYEATIVYQFDRTWYHADLKGRTAEHHGPPLLEVAVSRRDRETLVPLGILTMGQDRTFSESHLDAQDPGRVWFKWAHHISLRAVWPDEWAMAPFVVGLFSRLESQWGLRAGLEEPQALTAEEVVLLGTLRRSADALKVPHENDRRTWVVLGPSALAIPGVSELVEVLEQKPPGDRLLVIPKDKHDALVYDEVVGAARFAQTEEGALWMYATDDDPKLASVIKDLREASIPFQQRAPITLWEFVPLILADLEVRQAAIDAVLDQAKTAVGLEEAA